MDYETQLTQLINNTSQLINEVSGKFQQWDDKVNQAKAQINSFIAEARNDFAHENLIKKEHWRFEKDARGNFQHPFVFYTPDSVVPSLSFVDMSNSTVRNGLPKIVKKMINNMLDK